MAEIRDPAIKLFGMTIPLSPITKHVAAPNQQYSSNPNSNFHPLTDKQGDDNKTKIQKPSENELSESLQKDSSSPPTAEDSIDSATPCENPKTPSFDKENSSPETTKNEEQSERSNSEEKTLKKPDKIVPCPRCSSMDTKFCYYNNYNVNQPRHFCKNCQRYWTAGGTMRNVPVGSGRRKNKSSSSASHYRQILVSEALLAAQSEAANGVPHSALTTNGTVLAFGTDATLCESIASALNLAEKSKNCARNGFHGTEPKTPHVPCGGRENGDDPSCGSSITASNSSEKVAHGSFQGFPPPQVSCFSGPPWPCPMNSVPWGSAMPQAAVGPSGYPMSFYPSPPYWGCALPGPWNMPWIPPTPQQPLNSSVMTSTPNSPTLGKHSRDGENEEPLKNRGSEGHLWVPKTLRIDDPNEAARSSIWSTLGIKNEKGNPINEGGLFKAFQSKCDEKTHGAQSSLVLHANPAALSRSLNFHESTE